MKAGRPVNREAGTRKGVAAALLAICMLFHSSTALMAQVSSPPRWVVAAGGSVVLRTEHPGSFGGHLRLSRVLQPMTALFLEPGLTWHGYTRSPQSHDVCPIEGCPPIRRDGVSLLGLELGATFRKAGAENPVQPLASIGLYRSSSQDRSLARFGAAAGLLIPFRRSGLGPALDLRYFRMFGDPRFKSLVPVSLRWSF
jgi:hypothetical protein